jgi:hypothetical protein
MILDWFNLKPSFTMPTSWKVSGSYFETCNCEAACPCIFLSPPTSGDAGAPFAAVPGVSFVVAKSKQARFSDYGLDWELSNKNGFFSPFTYES